MKPRVYVAGPIFSSGLVTHNIHKAIKVAEALRKAGVIPFVPHLFCCWDTISPHTPEYWLEMDKSWLACCDAMVVLPGKSLGAEKEAQWAADFGIPVFRVQGTLRSSVQELLTDLHQRGLM